MKKVEVKFTGKKDDLEDFINCSCQYYSGIKKNNHSINLLYIIETNDNNEAIEIVQDSINIDAINVYKVELDYIKIRKF